MDDRLLRALIRFTVVGTWSIAVYPFTVGLLWPIIVIGVALGSAIAALVMCLTIQWTCQFNPAYREVFKASCLGFLSALLVIAGSALIGRDDPTFVYLVYGTAFLTDAIILGYMIQNTVTGPIGPLKGLLLSVIHIVTIVGTVLLLCLVMR